MEARYATWIEDLQRRRGGDVYNACEEVTLEMLAAFPELRRVRGLVEMLEHPDERRRPHWWLVDEHGVIVDPTREQFPGAIAYEEVAEERGKVDGRCLNCDGLVYRNDDHGGCCSEACATALAAYYEAEAGESCD